MISPIYETSTKKQKEFYDVLREKLIPYANDNFNSFYSGACFDTNSNDATVITWMQALYHKNDELGKDYFKSMTVFVNSMGMFYHDEEQQSESLKNKIIINLNIKNKNINIKYIISSEKITIEIRHNRSYETYNLDNEKINFSTEIYLSFIGIKILPINTLKNLQEKWLIEFCSLEISFSSRDVNINIKEINNILLTLV